MRAHGNEILGATITTIYNSPNTVIIPTDSAGKLFVAGQFR